MEKQSSASSRFWQNLIRLFSQLLLSRFELIEREWAIIMNMDSSCELCEFEGEGC